MITAVQVSLSSSSLFPSSFAALVFSFVLILWILSEVIGAGVQPLIRGGRRARRRRQDRGSFLLIYAGVVVYFIIAFSFAGSGVGELPSSVFYLGIFIMVLGIVIRQWAIAVLGRFFSRTVAVQEKQTVVETGPYRYVRHPSYTGALIFFVGFGLALQSGGAVPCARADIRSRLRVPHSCGREAFDCSTRRSICVVRAQDETAYSLRDLTESAGMNYL